MNLTPPLFDRRFNDFVEIGLAKLRSLAPSWTDYNAHDPGITLLELLAWNAEAQTYALSRMRRDEREAYAAMFGLKPEGARPAEGMIWPTRQKQGSVHSDLTNTLLDVDADIGLEGTNQPRFYPRDRLLLVAGSILAVNSRRLGNPTNQSSRHIARLDPRQYGSDRRTSLRRDIAFPTYLFGHGSGRDHVVEIDIECRDPKGLFGNDIKKYRTGRLALGFLVPGVRDGDPIQTLLSHELTQWNTIRPEVTATMVTSEGRSPLGIVWDSSFGLMQSGVMLFDLSSIGSSPHRFTVQLRATRGFPRPPRVSRIDMNVIPVVQGRSIVREMHSAMDVPHWSVDLQEIHESSGLQFECDNSPVLIEVQDGGRLTTWNRVEQLSDWGPQDCVYECDISSARVTFGNGLNGKLPRDESYVYATYQVCDGDSGNVSRNRKWKVPGFQGTFGSNPLPIAGGQDAQPAFSKRREARQQSRMLESLVTDDDIASAAMTIPLLDVSRAWIAGPGPHSPATNAIQLIAIRNVGAINDRDTFANESWWLKSVHKCLKARIPLGTRLEVSSPSRTPFSFRATLEVATGTNTQSVYEAITQVLRTHFALYPTAQRSVDKLLEPGSLVTLIDIACLIRQVAGVQYLCSLELFDGEQKRVGKLDCSLVPSIEPNRSNTIQAKSDGLLWWLEDQSPIVIRVSGETRVVCESDQPDPWNMQSNRDKSASGGGQHGA
jgi:hypothetical protein